MHDFEKIPSLVGEIYDAALNPTLWSSVLVNVATFIGGSAASLFSKDAKSLSGAVFHYGGDIDPHYTHLYFTKYVKFDPTTSAHVLADVEQPICTGDIMPFDDFRKTRIYEEWVQPQGWIDCLTTPLDKTATGAALFGVFRREEHGPVDEAARARMRQVVPHIRRAALIGRSIEQKAAEADTFADTLDGLSAGMFLVDGAGRIVHANASGRALLADGGVLRAHGDRLMATSAAAAQALTDIFAGAGQGDAVANAKGIAVPLTGRDGQRYVSHVLPLTAGARRRAGANHAAVAAVFVRKASIEAPSPPETIARHYSLTPTELRVLLVNVEVGGVAETADALGIAAATVKTHLHRVFGKTGVNRQADLVKLVAGFANPLLA
jgi:DNA-binding CsgD family transcriptional regulator